MAALLLANEWMSNNTFSPVPYVNRQIAKEIAKRTSLRVFSTVIDSKVPKDVEEDARMSNVELIGPHVDGFIATLRLTPTRDWLFLYKHFYPKIQRLGLPIRLVVGHSASGEDNTASAACSILKEECNKDTHLWIFVHFIPDRLIRQPKEYVDSPGFREEKAKEIVDCAVRSNLVAAVGQIVYNHFKNTFRGLDDRDRPEFKCYLPYPEEQFSKLRVSPADIKTHAEILMICNKHGEDQVQLAKFESIVESICEMSCKRPDVTPIFKVHTANISNEGLRSWLNGQIAKQPGPGPANITVVTSSNTKASDISTALRQCTLLIDQDLESTFSVIGLNCLAAGTPCLLSNHCGLAKFVSEDATLTFHSDNITVNIGAGHNHDNMVREWTSSLNKVFGNYDREFRRSQELKTLINSSATDGTIANLMESLMENCPGNEGRDHGTNPRESSATSVSPSQSETVSEPSDSQGNQDTGKNLVVKVTARDSMDTVSQSDLDDSIFRHISSDEQLPTVRRYFEENNVTMGKPSQGESLVVPAKVTTIEGLETLWSDMWNGKLDEVFRKDLITRDVLKRVKTTTISVKANIRTWEYKQCKAFLHYSCTEFQVSISEVGRENRKKIKCERIEDVNSFIRRIRLKYNIPEENDVLLYNRVQIPGSRSRPLEYDKAIHSCSDRDFVFYVRGRNLKLGALEMSCSGQNIAIVGSPSHGKSSTINTISKSLGQPAPIAQTYPSGAAGTSSLTRHELHVNNSSFKLFDVPGYALVTEESRDINLNQTLKNIFQGKEKPNKKIGESTRRASRRHRQIHAVVVVQKGTADIKEITSAALSCARSSGRGIPVFVIITHLDRMTKSSLHSMKAKLADDEGIDRSFIFAIANDDSQDSQAPEDPQREEYVRSMLNTILAASKRFKESLHSGCTLQ